MSAAQLWRQIVSRVETVADPHCGAPAMVVNSVSKPEFSLIHQLFFSPTTQSRNSVLLVTTGAQSRAAGLCERLATALANVSGKKVGVIEAGGNENLVVRRKKSPFSMGQVDRQKPLPLTSGSVHKVPFESVASERSGFNEMRSECEYFLLCASMADSEMPALCNMCDAAVLVLTASLTRRAAAQKAKEQLIRQGVTVLGVVLDQRTFPIPESIYRRL
jgi:hypothetical protein